MKRLLFAFLIILMPGCASDRWLTVEEDANLKAKCEATGCVAVPNPVWKHIENILRTLNGVAI